jgi:hypothetical protein
MEYIEYDLNITQEAGDCWGIFLDALKLNFSNFAMYQNNKLYFLPEDNQEEIQEWINNFKCSEGEDTVYNGVSNIDITTVVRTVDPTIYENLDKDIIWINKRTGEIFTCIDDSIDANIWKGTTVGKIIRPVPPANKVDFFEDHSSLFFLQMNGDAKDMGGLYHGNETGIKWKTGLDGECAYSGRGQIRVNNLPIENTDAITISAWVKWTGRSGTMPFGFKQYDLYCYSGNLGFNTAGGDLLGFSFKEYRNKWIYLTVVFKRGEPGDIYINGEKQELTQILRKFSSVKATWENYICIYGWGWDRGYRAFGYTERVRAFSKALTEKEVQELTFAETSFINKLTGGTR